jgi:hypothetical protein
MRIVEHHTTGGQHISLQQVDENIILTCTDGDGSIMVELYISHAESLASDLMDMVRRARESVNIETFNA